MTDPGGVILSAARYDPWGELRAVSGTSQTSYGYTGQRAEKGLGLYFYGARWYDPQLSRFLSADSIIPQQQGVQAWDRYAYVNNSPTTGVDPTGHTMTQCGLDGQDCGANAAQVAYETKRYYYENCSSGYGGGCPEVIPPDAYLLSVSFTAGAGPVFRSTGVDLVVTDNQIGVFNVKAAGPWAGGSERYGAHGSAEDATWVSPQFGGSALVGVISSDVIGEDVNRYAGTALVAGGSVGTVGGEWFSSIGDDYGVPNGDVSGSAAGATFGPTPVEAHVYYTYAEPIPWMSKTLTAIGRFFGLLGDGGE